jgi:threonine dehydrogenase-like Zn-dependent dehydrogenase
MRAMVYRGPYKVRVEERDMPSIEHPNDAIIRWRWPLFSLSEPQEISQAGQDDDAGQGDQDQQRLKVRRRWRLG